MILLKGVTNSILLRNDYFSERTLTSFHSSEERLKPLNIIWRMPFKTSQTTDDATCSLSCRFSRITSSKRICNVSSSVLQRSTNNWYLGDSTKRDWDWKSMRYRIRWTTREWTQIWIWRLLFHDSTKTWTIKEAYEQHLIRTTWAPLSRRSM